MNSSRFFCAFIPAFAILFSAAGADLVFQGKPACCIVVSPKADRVLRHGAKELSHYLGKISGSPAPQILPSAGKPYPVILTQDPSVLNAAEKKAAASVKDDGFLLSSNAQRTVIYAKMPRGVLYGVYEILKEYGGIRWITPGADGEYFTPKKTIRIPEGIRICNPSFKIRSQIIGSCNVNSFLADSWNWMVRNNMWISAGSDNTERNGRDYLLDRSGGVYQGGHIVASLMTGAWITCSGVEGRRNFTELQKKHPEYFPVINGKRSLGRFGENNPCLAQKGVLDLMRGNLMVLAEKMKNPNSFCVLGNNDSQMWCQCPYCTKLDPPAEAAKQMIPTRYWTLVNSLAAPVLDKYPHANLWGWAYQNFQDVPAGIKPDPRLTVMLTYNARCYRHRLTDKNCPHNRRYLQYMKNWKKLPNTLCTWEQVEDGMAVRYQPFENIMAQNILDMKKLKLDGMMLCNYPPDGTYSKRHDSYSMHPRHTWFKMWRSVYIASRLLWDSSRDWEKELEEAGKLYYGPAWEKGMKQYCALLLRTEQKTAGCMGWGSAGSDPGLLLKDQKVHNQLKAYLASAEAAAVFDPRAAYHVSRDRLYFEKTWEAYYQLYKEKRPPVTAYARTGRITLDGKLEEPDWKKAETVTDFIAMADGSGKTVKADPQTSFQVVYEPGYLYIGITAKEPQMNLIVNNCTKHDGDVWADNEVEIFLHHPYLDENYYHLCITSGGAMYDGFKVWGNPGEDESWTSDAEFKVRKEKDFWTVELRIPTKSMRIQCNPGEKWKINVARSRNIAGGRYGKENQLSSSAGGTFHNSAFFTELNFKEKK